MRRELVYVGDPLCGWCFGFTEIFEKIIEKYKNTFNISIVMGGLKVKDSIMVNSKTKGFIVKNWNNVMTTTGQEFAVDLIDSLPEGEYNSEPLCRAVVTVKKLKPACAVPYYKALHKAMYLEGKKINDPELLCEIATKFGVLDTVFNTKFASEEIKAETQKEFDYAKNVGVLGFPAFVLVDETGSFVLNQGYKPLQNIELGIENWINGVKQIIF